MDILDNNIVEDLEDIEEETIEEKPVTLFAIVTNAELVNMRSKPTKESDVVTVMKKETLVEVIEDLGDWYHIANTSGIEGYTMKEFISII